MREVKSLLLTDGSGGNALDETNIHHVPWLFSNLPVDCCSECLPEVSNNNSVCISNSSQYENNSDDEKQLIQQHKNFSNKQNSILSQ